VITGVICGKPLFTQVNKQTNHYMEISSLHLSKIMVYLGKSLKQLYARVKTFGASLKAKFGNGKGDKAIFIRLESMPLD
jgi:hypothetical protein